MKFFTSILFLFYQYTISAQSISFQYNCDLIQEDQIIYQLDSLDGISLSMLDTIADFGPSPFCSEGGTTHNQNWLSFIAKEGEYKIILSASNCTENGGFIGVQTAIYTNCNFEENIFCQPNCVMGITEIPSDKLIPGERYYLILDGCTGSVCDITFTIDDYVSLGCITEWQSSVGGLGGNSQFNYFYAGDTIISNLTYRKIDIDPSPGFLATRYIREESKIVYEYSLLNNNESVIYDFTLELGDQLEYGDGFVGTVINIDTVLLSDVRYTRWQLDGAGPPYEYMEGIGGDHLFYADQLGISDPVFSTSCVYKYCDKIMGLQDCMSKISWDSVTNIDTSICQGDEIVFGESVISAQGEYTNVLTNSVGCDSIFILNVSILEPGRMNLQESICEGETFIINGIIFDQNSPSGNIILAGGAANGCDSIINVTLSFVSDIVENYQATICEGSSEIWADSLITMAGDYTFNLVSINGCDSIINLSVDVIPDIIFEESLVACEGESIELSGTVYTASGIYQNDFEASNGCDSVVIYDLTFLPVATETDTFYICPGDSVVIGEIVVLSEGLYQNFGIGENGCDSIYTANVVELPPSDSECLSSIYDLQGFDLDISPNPFDQSINLYSDELIQSIEVTSISGLQMIFVSNLNSQEYTYNGSDLAAGVYILTVRSNDKIAIKRIVKN